MAVRAKATAGDTARIWSTGGSTNIDTNTASISFVTLSGEIITDATPTNIVLNFGSNTATDIVWFDKLMIQEGEVPAVFLYHHNDQHLKAVDYQDTVPTSFVYGLLRMQAMTVNITFPNAQSSSDKVVTFPSAFSKILAIVSIGGDKTNNHAFAGVKAGTKAVSGFTAYAYDAAAARTGTWSWDFLAIGVD